MKMMYVGQLKLSRRQRQTKEVRAGGGGGGDADGDLLSATERCRKNWEEAVADEPESPGWVYNMNPPPWAPNLLHEPLWPAHLSSPAPTSSPSHKPSPAIAPRNEDVRAGGEGGVGWGGSNGGEEDEIPVIDAATSFDDGEGGMEAQGKGRGGEGGGVLGGTTGGFDATSKF